MFPQHILDKQGPKVLEYSICSFCESSSDMLRSHQLCKVLFQVDIGWHCLTFPHKRYACKNWAHSSHVCFSQLSEVDHPRSLSIIWALCAIYVRWFHLAPQGIVQSTFFEKRIEGKILKVSLLSKNNSKLSSQVCAVNAGSVLNALPNERILMNKGSGNAKQFMSSPLADAGLQNWESWNILRIEVEKIWLQFKKGKWWHTISILYHKFTVNTHYVSACPEFLKYFPQSHDLWRRPWSVLVVKQSTNLNEQHAALR